MGETTPARAPRPPPQHLLGGHGRGKIAVMKLLAPEALIAAVLMALLSGELSFGVCVPGGCFSASCCVVGCSLVFSLILLRWISIN